MNVSCSNHPTPFHHRHYYDSACQALQTASLESSSMGVGTQSSVVTSVTPALHGPSTEQMLNKACYSNGRKKHLAQLPSGIILNRNTVVVTETQETSNLNKREVYSSLT